MGLDSRSLRATVATVCVALMAMAATTQAGVISWCYDNNSTIGGNGAGSLPPLSAVAGVVPAGGWTNHWPDMQMNNLRDDTGAATTLDISWDSYNGWSITGSHPGQDSDGTYNKELLNGYLNAGPATWNPVPTYSQIVISQIPYTSYDIIVYFSSDTAGREGDVTDGATTYSFQTVGPSSVSGSNAVLLETTDTIGSYTTTANYATFSGLTGTTQTITVQMRDNDEWGGIAGFQVSGTGGQPNGLYFSASAPGEDKSVDEWGPDAAWPNEWNMFQSVAHMGIANVDVVRLNFYTDEAPDPNGRIGPTARSRLDTQLSIAALAGSTPLALTPSGTTIAYYKSGGDVNVTRWVDCIKATQDYITQQTGQQVVAVEPFNEPDFWTYYGSASNLNAVMNAMAGDSAFNGVALMGASTLNCDNAQWWYDQCSGPATHGSTHLLGGSAYSYVNFLQHVAANGDVPSNPELHSLAEAILGAEYGMESGIWWGAMERPRGLFVQASDGQRLGYAENLAAHSAAAVYRAPDGQIRAFAGGFERSGSPARYKLISSDGPVYYNGIYVTEYMLQTVQDYHGFVDIDPNAATAFPPLDGYRWKIVNRATGDVLEVVSGGTADGDLIRMGSDVGAAHQRWNIVRKFHEYDGLYKLNGYLGLINGNSGLAAEVANFDMDPGASVRQWGDAENFTRHWYIEKADAGYYYIRNANSTLYLRGDATNAYQDAWSTSLRLQWQFVLDNPTPLSGTVSQFEFNGNVRDAFRNYEGTAFGSPTYGNGLGGADQAIELDGLDDYVLIDTGVADLADITVAAWIKWDGGGAWQRLFDFGNDTTEYMFLTPSSGDGTTLFTITDNGALQLMLETDPLPVGQWVHVAVTLGGNTGILYVNGEAKIAGQIPLDSGDFNPVLCYIGKSQYTQDPLFDGTIDQLQVFDFALSAAQIADLAASPIAADLDGDYDVDSDDLAVFVECMAGPDVLTPPAGCDPAMFAAADLDGDGDVDAEDLAEFQTALGV